MDSYNCYDHITALSPCTADTEATTAAVSTEALAANTLVLFIFTRHTPISEMTYTVSSGTLNSSIPHLHTLMLATMAYLQ